MKKKLSIVEQDFVEVVSRSSMLTTLGLSIGSLVAEMRRAPQAQGMVIRVGMTSRVAEEVKQTQVYLADLSQKLAALEQEHAEKL